MGILSRMAAEKRASIENPSVPLSSPEAFALIFGESGKSATGVSVTVEKAMGVPAVWASTNFISSELASLPLQVYRSGPEGRIDVARGDRLHTLLHDVVNDDKVTSFKWRKQTMMSVLTGGRAFTFIERSRAGRVANLWPLDPKTVTVRRRDNRTSYEVKDGQRTIAYEAGEILDLPFLLLADGLSHLSPVSTLKNAIGLAIAMEEYASRFFHGGGVPPLSLHGPMASPNAVRRATSAIDDAMRQVSQENRNVLYMPAGHELKPIGFHPEQGQLMEARLFQLREIARIYSIPPSFLQDLQFGTFSNTEQQDLHFVKHTLMQWLELWEQELNAKLFGPRNQSGRFAEFNVDGLLRGDFKTRMDGYAQGIQNAVMTPDEARRMENRPTKGGRADSLFINSAVVPVDSDQSEAPADGEGDDDGED